MRALRLRLLVACALLAVALAARGAAAEDPSAIHDRARAALDEGIQTEMPGDTPRATPSASAPSRDIAPARPREDLPPVSPLSSIARLLLWCLIIAALALLLVAVAREIIARREDGDAAAEAPAIDGAPRRAAPVISLSEAEALARAGRYADAIHALLGTVLGHLGRQGGVAMDPSTTSREVLEGARLEPAARGALSDLVLTVEVSLFGGLDVDEGDYQRCMASFQRLEEALSRR